MLPLTASDLYALAHGTKNEGEERCHWCGSACKREWLHDDPPPMIGVRCDLRYTKIPGSHYYCRGCWLFKRNRITVNFLTGGYKDSQDPQKHSWFITETTSSVLELSKDKTELYEQLLSPPLRFTLALLDGVGSTNHLQSMVVNDNTSGINANTPLLFTINDIVHTYTPYELDTGLKQGADGRIPGVRALIRLLGEYVREEEKRGRGRPIKEEKPNNKNVRAKSGA